MRAERLRAFVEDDHRLTLQLPPEVPSGAVDVIVLYPDTMPAPANAPRERRFETLASFTEWLEKQPPGKRTREEIDRQIAEERASWS